MSGIIDIRVVTEAPFKLAVGAGVMFFVLAHWQMPGSFSSLFARVPLLSSLNPFTQVEVIKSLVLAAIVWFVLRYKKKWALAALQVDAVPPVTTTSSKA
ncbi:hypothetical protein WJX74_007159 [Apatococcus lobatus]|uniref:Uncharacterized protein n=1 Tax=Apatococcus lobatus TaxID=904363 RepID=A0AAW1Q1H7_9CHLO